VIDSCHQTALFGLSGLLTLKNYNSAIFWTLKLVPVKSRDLDRFIPVKSVVEAKIES